MSPLPYKIRLSSDTVTHGYGSYPKVPKALLPRLGNPRTEPYGSDHKHFPPMLADTKKQAHCCRRVRTFHSGNNTAQRIPSGVLATLFSRRIRGSGSAIIDVDTLTELTDTYPVKLQRLTFLKRFKIPP